MSEDTRPVISLNIPPSAVKVGTAAETELKKLSRESISAKIAREKIMSEEKPKFETLSEALSYYQKMGMDFEKALQETYRHRELVERWMTETLERGASGG